MCRKCLICNVRPVQRGQEAGYCSECQKRIDADSAKTNNKLDAYRYLTYRGAVIALVPSGKGVYRGVSVNKSPETLPKNKTEDLNVFLPHFDRTQVKNLKRLFARLPV
jgi:hypothetical protein